MGGILHLFEFNQPSMSHKVLTHNRHTDGLEAPRNSLELTETSQAICSMGSNIQHSYQMKQNSSKKNCYPSETSMKKLIDEEISKGPDLRRNVPSVVARLMGMDMLPSDPKPTIHAKEKKNEKPGNNSRREEQVENVEIGHNTLNSKNCKQTELDLLSHHKEREFDQSLKYGKPRPREHPQEEQLQKFKKDFEAWQAARVWERSRIVELGRIPSQWLAQENLNKEKMALCEGSSRSRENEKPIELMCYDSLPIRKEKGVCSFKKQNQHHGSKKEALQANPRESVTLRSRPKTSDFELVPVMNCDKKPSKSSIPTKIVILKPGPISNGGRGEPWAGPSEIVEEEGGIEDFLEEVKEKLRCEIQGKSTKRNMVIRGGGIETPFSEKLSDSKEIALHIAKQVRESVTRDLGMNLLRSESTRSYRSEIQVNGSGSPEFINEDTRKFLSDRLRNVLKGEIHVDFPRIGSGSSRASVLDHEGGRLRPTGDLLTTGSRGSCLKNVKDEPEMQSRSFRHGQNSDEMLYTGEVSPRNLIRSLSAPVSGTSFGKLLLEDRHILTGAHIRRKHEASENISVEVRKMRKERSLREKVSKFRYSFTLRGKLFGRKIQSVEEPVSNEFDYMKDVMDGPTVVTNLGNAYENSTEVPPSPASVCSSAHEEFCSSADHLNPVMTLDTPLIEDCTVPRVFEEISSNLHELRRQLNQLESDDSKDMAIREEYPEVETVELEGQAEAYIRNLLVASGLYDGSSNRSFSKWDSLGKPISNRVFEEVEESNKRRSKENEESTKDHSESKVLDHKVLFDLLNEALSTILRPPLAMSRFKRKILGITTVPPIYGKTLLDAVWEMIRVYVYPSMASDELFYSLDSVVARDLGKTHWSWLMHDDVDLIGREMGQMILGELIEETVMNMCL